MPREEAAGWRGRGSRKRLPVPRRAQSPEPGRGAQVFGGSPGTAWAGGARIVAGRLLSSSRGDWQGSRLFSSRRRTRRVPRRRRQQQAPRRRNAGGGSGGGGGGGVCARLAFPPPRQGERGGGEARGGLNPGSPNSVPRDLRRGRDAPSLPTAPCDSARAAWPRRASHSRATAAAGPPPSPSPPCLSLPGRSILNLLPGSQPQPREGVGASPHPAPEQGLGQTNTLGSGHAEPRA